MSPSTSSGVRLLAPMMRSISRLRCEAALVAHRRQMQALVEDFLGLAGTRSRHRPADVALMRDRAAKADTFALEEDRRQHRHVRRMWAAAFVGVVDEKGVAFGDVVIIAQDRGATGRKGADMQRQNDMLGDDVAAPVHDCAGRILRFPHDGRIAGAKQRILHFLHDAVEARLDDLDVDRAEARCLFPDCWRNRHVRRLRSRRGCS